MSDRLTLWAYRLLPAVLLPLMLVLTRDFGITWDEKTHQMYGEAVWLYLTQGTDSHWFHPEWYMYLHGGLVDSLGAGAQRLLGTDIWAARHYVLALFGWLGIVYAGRLGRLLGGAATGLLAMTMLVLSPRYFADSMNNPKDVAFAALSTAALYYTMRLEPQLPVPRPAPVRAAGDVDRAGAEPAGGRPAAAGLRRARAARADDRASGLGAAAARLDRRSRGRAGAAGAARRDDLLAVGGRSGPCCARCRRSPCCRSSTGIARCCSRAATCARPSCRSTTSRAGRR